MMAQLGLIALGFGLCAMIVAGISVVQWLSSRPRRSRMDGSYHDARKPFAIVSGGPAHGPERSDELIARTARRMMRRGSETPSRSVTLRHGP